jgi:hypothetical protein
VVYQKVRLHLRAGDLLSDNNFGGPTILMRRSCFRPGIN